jgi:autotransporter-associated beta strand protein
MRMRQAAVILMLGISVSSGAAVECASAATATSLNSFEGREEPSVLYHPSSDSFTSDSYTNITDQGRGIIRYTLRYQPNQDWWDGDRSTTNDDRQRAEVKGLGAHQKTDQTFRYTFDWRTDPNFVGTGSFCHIFQLKSTDGDSGAPLVTLSLNSGGNGSLRIWSGSAGNSSTARSFQWTPDTWTHADIIITTSQGNTGSVIASINGDSYSGKTVLPVYRPDATDYRPKWGLYRGINSALYVGTNWVEDMGVTASRIAANEIIWNPYPSSDTAWNEREGNNWIKSGMPGGYADGNDVIFGDTGVGDVVVAAGGVAPRTIDVSNSMGDYRFVGGPITASGDLNKSGGGILTISNDSEFAAGATVAAGTLAVSGSLGGSVQVNAGATLQSTGVIEGEVDVLPGGKFSPGFSAGTTTVQSLLLHAGSLLDIELGGSTPGAEYDHIQVTDSVTLGGTLQVSLTGAFAPQAGQSFNILGWSHADGAFDSLALPDLSDNLSWQIEYGPAGASLVVVLPGDFNNDGTVSAADYVSWRKGLGTTFTSADYDVWHAHFGQTAAGGSGGDGKSPVPVPEPLEMGVTSIGLGLTPFFFGSRKSTRKSTRR